MIPEKLRISWKRELRLLPPIACSPRPRACSTRLRASPGLSAQLLGLPNLVYFNVDNHHFPHASFIILRVNRHVSESDYRHLLSLSVSGHYLPPLMPNA